MHWSHTPLLLLPGCFVLPLSHPVHLLLLLPGCRMLPRLHLVRLHYTHPPHLLLHQVSASVVAEGEATATRRRGRRRQGRRIASAAQADCIVRVQDQHLAPISQQQAVGQL